MCRRYTYRIMRFRWWCAGARGWADTPCWLPWVVLCGRMQWVWRSDRIRHVLTCRLRTAREETCSAGSSLCKQGLKRRIWGACVPRAADPPAEGVCWTAAQACLLSRLARSAELPAVRERGPQQELRRVCVRSTLTCAPALLPGLAYVRLPRSVQQYAVVLQSRALMLCRTSPLREAWSCRAWSAPACEAVWSLFTPQGRHAGCFAFWLRALCTHAACSGA